MTSNTSSRFMRLKAEIANAGGFGDGIDTSEYDVKAELGDFGYTQPQRLEVSVALLAELADAIDSADWESVQASELAKAARLAVLHGWLSDQLLAAAVRALDESEKRFFQALASVYAVYVDAAQESPPMEARGPVAGEA